MTYRLTYSALQAGKTAAVTKLYMHDIDVPLYADYKFNILGNTSLITGAGFSGMFNLSVDEDYISKDIFTPYLLLRTGFEVRASHKMQFLLQYRWSMSENAEYPWDKSYPRLDEKPFRMNIFEAGVTFFF